MTAAPTPTWEEAIEGILFDLAFAIGGLGQEPDEPIREAKQAIQALYAKQPETWCS